MFRVFDFNFPNYKSTYVCILSIVSYLMEMKVVSKSRLLFHHSNMPLKIVWTRETRQEINKRGKIHSNVNAGPFCLARPTKDAFCPSRYSTRRPQTAKSENVADFPAWLENPSPNYLMPFLFKGGRIAKKVSNYSIAIEQGLDLFFVLFFSFKKCTLACIPRASALPFQRGAILHASTSRPENPKSY